MANNNIGSDGGPVLPVDDLDLSSDLLPVEGGEAFSSALEGAQEGAQASSVEAGAGGD